MDILETPVSTDALYERVARKVEHLIRAGTLRSGERIPSVRQASRQHGVSVTTVLQAYLQLEDRGLIEGRPKSGFFVRPRLLTRLKEPEPSRPAPAAAAVSVGALQSRLFEAIRIPGVIPFGSASPGPELLPGEKLNRIMASLCRSAGARGTAYAMPPGSETLRREIARRSLESGADLTPDDVITTCGGTEALMLCLRAVTRPGDVVAVESPTYFGILHAVEELGLKAVEIPMDPAEGMDLHALERALKRQKIAACISIPNFSNPLCSLMPDEAKERLAALLARHGTPLIEDDIFGELHHGDDRRPRTVKSFDRAGLVMLCGSFSKTLAPGYRVGWVAPGKFFAKVKTLKLISTLATASLPELAVAEFLANGGYDHYLRSVRRTYARNVELFSEAVAASFPFPVRITRPKGGFVLWIELPEGADALRLDDLALGAKISIAPGPMFSATQGYRNFIRLSCGHTWTPDLARAIATLGKLAGRIVES